MRAFCGLQDVSGSTRFKSGNNNFGSLRRTQTGKKDFGAKKSAGKIAIFQNGGVDGLGSGGEKPRQHEHGQQLNTHDLETTSHTERNEFFFNSKNNNRFFNTDF